MRDCRTWARLESGFGAEGYRVTCLCCSGDCEVWAEANVGVVDTGEMVLLCFILFTSISADRSSCSGGLHGFEV